MSKTGIATGGDAFGVPNFLIYAFAIFAGIDIASALHEAAEARKRQGF